MTERQFAFWRVALGNWLNKLSTDQKEELLLIISSLGPLRAAQALVTDLEEILGPVTEVMTKGV